MRPTMFSCVVCPLLALAIASPAAAQEQKPTIRHDSTTMILPAGSYAVRDVVDATARFLQRNILTDAQELASVPGTIELQTPLQLDAAKCETAVSELLFAAGFVLVPRDASNGLYEAVLLRGARGQEIMNSAVRRTPEQILAQPTLKQPVMTIVPVERMPAVVAVNALRPFFASQRKSGLPISIGTAGDNSSLILGGLQSDVASAIDIVQKADAAAPGGAAAAGGPAVGFAGGPAGADLGAQLAALTKTVQELQQRIAELEKRLAAK